MVLHKLKTSGGKLWWNKNEHSSTTGQTLEADPLKAWRATRKEVGQAFQEPGIMDDLPLPPSLLRGLKRESTHSGISSGGRSSGRTPQRRMSTDTTGTGRRRSWQQSVAEGAAILGQAAVDSVIGAKNTDIEDGEDEYLSEEEYQKLYQEAFGRKPTLMKSGAARFDWAKVNRRQRAMEALGLDDSGFASDNATAWQWLQAKTGLQELRIRIVMKKHQVREEKPYFESLYLLASNRKFELLIAVLIMLNCICIGWESYYRYNEERPGLLAASDHIFTAIFLAEFIIRIMAYTWVWVFSSPMNAFDTFLIWVPGVLIVWVLPAAGAGEATQILQAMGALRILRLARLCRAIRMIPMFRVLWILVHGLMECSSLLFWTWVIVGMIHFMFGVAVVELVAKTDTFSVEGDELSEDVQYYFGSLVPAMCTLFQMMTFDAWGAIVRPIIRRSPATFLIFGLWLGIAGVVFLNLMTAIVVQNAFEQVKSDVEAQEHWNNEKEKSIIGGLRRIFDDMDEDNSGTLTREEFSDVLVDIDFIRKMRSLDIELEELPDVFDILDDGDGVIDAQEFISGLMWMQGNAMNRDIMKATNLIRYTTKHLNHTMEDLETTVFESLDFQAECWTNVHDDAESAIRLTGEIIGKQADVGVRNLALASFESLPVAPDAAQTKFNTSTSSWRKAEKSIFQAPAHAQLQALPQDWVQSHMEARGRRGNLGPRSEANMAKQLSVKDTDRMIVEVLEDYEDSWNKLDLRLMRAHDLRDAAHAYRLPKQYLSQVCSLPGDLAGLPPKRDRVSKRKPRSKGTKERSRTRDRMAAVTSMQSEANLPHHPHRVPE
mmetsp:Transcript_57861/g.137751  ORF Transcript_57861/g.137751 Transcript_57861/m.137751 type:complete len:828 (+) Transcript_57861:125-2608(+)